MNFYALRASAALRADSPAYRGAGSYAMPVESLSSFRRTGCTVGASQALGTVTVEGRASTLTSASRPQASHVAVTARTPFLRMFANVMGGPGLLRRVASPGKFLARNRRT